ncbi:MAG: GGDEF domain-containing protein [Campylobacterota bacterium]|nr:GGDEF domain-containing protein [Campylobacterota bacterium]
MAIFQHLSKLQKYSTLAFEAFYHELTQDAKFSKFFEDEKQIKELIIKQEKNFIDTLAMDRNNIKENYIYLGQFHYDINIPYIDFIRGVDILEADFLRQIKKKEFSLELVDEIIEYFKLMKSYTAKGYLGRITQKDKRDIEVFMEQAKEMSTYLPKDILTEKIMWLKSFITMIEHGRLLDNSRGELPERWFSNILLIPTLHINFFQDIKERIINNTTNILYFLQKEEYMEVLPLYNSLISIYKMVFMMNGIHDSSESVPNLKYDAVAIQLYHKDLFPEIISKEFSFQQRSTDYSFTLLYIDCDDFKAIVERYGQYSGDRALDRLGQIIKTHIRTSDYGFRVDKDKFAIILKSAKRYIARKIAKKIASDFSDYSFIFDQDNVAHITLSIGIAEQSATCQHDKIESLLEEAEQNLMRAKNMGKDQIRL